MSWYGGKRENICRNKLRKKEKTIYVVELTDIGKIEQIYAKRIPDFSSKSIRMVFNSHLNKTPSITTDGRKGGTVLLEKFIRSI